MACERAMRRGRVRRFVAQQLDPPGQRRQRCAQLVRRLARHAGPDFLAVRTSAFDATRRRRRRAGARCAAACRIGMTRSPCTIGGSP